MGVESYSPITTLQEPGIQGMPRTYTSTREVATETQAPARGSVVGPVLGPVYAEHIVLSAQIVPKDGKRILTVQHCSPPDWTILYGSNRDKEINGAVAYSQQVVLTPSLATIQASPGFEFTPIDETKSFKRSTYIPTAALNAYVRSYPVRTNIDLPRVLSAVNVVWNQQYSIGTQDTQALDVAAGTSGSVSLSIPDRADSSASISAELQVTFKDFASNNLFAQMYAFFMPDPVNQSTVLARLSSLCGDSVTMWPVFKPESSTITITGQSIRVGANCQVALNHSWSPSSSSYGWTKSTSDDFGSGSSNNSVQLPPCIHPAITITGGTSKEQRVSATAFMFLASSFGASVSASITKSGTAYGEVSPTVIPATDTPEVPTTGLYLLDMDVKAHEEYEGWCRVRAVVFDATNLA